MTHIVIPTSDPVVTLNFDQVLGIDVSGYADTDYISFSLPAFPSTKLDLTQSFVDFTSNPDGEFGTGPTDSIAFSQASPALPGSDGDTEMRLSMGLLATIDKSALTGVRFRIYANSNCTFRCLSIRACSTSWDYAPIDIDTLWHRVGRPPSTNGSASQSSTFPTYGGSDWPTAWPILFRSDDLTGDQDPRPIDISFSSSFSAGTFVNATGADGAHFNTISFYMRDVPTDDQIMLELDSLTQADLDVGEGQPDFGTAAYTGRTQQNLDVYEQEEIDADTQFVLERLPDYSTHTWLEVKLKWCATQSLNTLTILNADGVGYSYSNVAIAATNVSDLDQGQYIVIVDLVDNSIRVRILNVDQVGVIDQSAPVFDSGAIIDDTLIKRRRGRFGWWSQFPDGDAFINDIRTRGLNFGEIITKEFQSITPVKGVSLYAGATTNNELFTEIGPTSFTQPVSITLDPSASSTGKAYKITSDPTVALQGITTNPFLIDDPNNIRISFNVKFPSSASANPGGALTAFLLGEYVQPIPVNLSFFKEDVWSKIRVTIPDILFQTGTYQLILLQTRPIVTTTWWLENVSIQTTTVEWTARSQAPSAWGVEDDGWMPALGTLNTLNGGIVFEEKGSGLQVRGQALRQDAAIHDFKAVPQYATLGNFIWNDEYPDPQDPPTVSISTSQSGLTVTATAVAYDPDGEIISVYWAFGDDSYDSGLTASHTYESAGTYLITVNVSDDFGNVTAAQASVSVP